MNWKAVVRDVIIVWVLTALGGFVVGVTAGLLGAQGGVANPRIILAIAVSNFVFGTVAFMMAGCLKKTGRFKHLAVVTVGAWLTSAVNMLFTQFTFEQWLLMPVSLAIMMVMGAGLSFLFVPARKSVRVP